MKKQSGFSAVVLLVVIVLLGAAVGVGIFAYKNISEKPAVTVEQDENIAIPKVSNDVNSQNDGNISQTPANEVVLSGQFKDGDAVHSGSGSVQVVQTTDGPVLSFGEDFKVTNGPDLLVYLSPNPAGEDLGEFASLGALRSNSGAQAYNLPDNYKDYKTVVIWCRAFSVTFSTAELN
jgi:hypothetical protein